MLPLETPTKGSLKCVLTGLAREFAIANFILPVPDILLMLRPAFDEPLHLS